jgi:Ca-activated chloride channel homolog
MLALSFERAGWLWLLLAPAALLVGYLVAQQRRPTYTARFTNLDLLDAVIPKRPAWRRHVPTALVLLGATALVLSIAKPTRPGTVEVQRATLMLALDVSISMQATDVDPDRLTAMKQAATEFVTNAPEKVRIGLVDFAANARVLVPPSEDRTNVLRAIERLKLREGTGIGEAIFASLDGLEADRELGQDSPPDSVAPSTTTPEAEADGPSPELIVVMSDGETTVGRTDEEASAAAAEQGIPVSAVAFGTPNGSIEYEGETATVPVEPDKLRAIAEATGGDFFEAASADELATVFDKTTTRVRSTQEDIDISPWFVGAGLGLVLLGAAAATWWFQRAL